MWYCIKKWTEVDLEINCSKIKIIHNKPKRHTQNIGHIEYISTGFKTYIPSTLKQMRWNEEQD